MAAASVKQDLHRRPWSDYPRHVRIDGERQTRVMDLLPGTFTDPIVCEVFPRDVQSDGHAEISARAEYDALSYVWGDFHEFETIRVNDVADFPITCNLAKALRNLRKEPGGTKSEQNDTGRYRLWVDQICIDQQEKTEVKQQVKHIGNIFRQAGTVFLWLGEVPPGLDLSAPSGRQKLNLRNLKKAKDQVQALSRAVTASDDHVGPWWTRSWVLEEYSLATKEPVAMIGRLRFPFEDLGSELGPAIVMDFVPVVNLWGDGTGIDLFAHMLCMLGLRSEDLKRSIFSLSYLLRNTKTKRPHDKIFCIMTSLPQEQRKLVTHDYQLPESRIFAEATFADIQLSENLAILGLVSRGASTPSEYPSWLVDFEFHQQGASARLQPPKYDLGLVKRMEETMKKQMKGISTIISLFTPAIFKRDESWRGWCRLQPGAKATKTVLDQRLMRLEVDGLQFDTVDSIFDLEEQVGFRNSIQFTSQLLLGSHTNSALSWFSRTVLNHTETEKHILRLLRRSPGAYQRIGNASPPPSAAQPEPPRLTLRHGAVYDLYKEWDRLARPRKARAQHESQIGAAWRFETMFEDASSFTAVLGLLYPFRAILFASVHLTEFFGKSAFFFTNAGFIGVGPPDIRKDDQIVLPSGSRYPMIVRRNTDDTWRFMGLVYIRGIMDDELMDCFEDLRLEQRRYVLA